ncbi:MAG: glutathione S-transferase family protein [Proteobacteria bacterium]|nr:glutathione S-transferase family protein [Pseudomonadota bacterium]
MSNYRLISFDLCPYVQRSVITLEEKGVEYDVEYIDLSNKPSWFVALSPLGKVPVLQVGEIVLFESAVINEFIDETAPGRTMHPSDPLERARHRSWIEFGSTALVDCYRLMVTREEQDARKTAQACSSKLQRLEGALSDDRFFRGDALSLVDAAIAPLLQRLLWCEQIVPELDLFRDVPKVCSWRSALLSHPSVERSTVTDIRDRFVEYLKGRGSPTRNTDPSWLGRVSGNQGAP